MTVRRDLDFLAAQGVLKRVHGGAMSAMPSGVEPPYSLRAQAAIAAKRAIAAAAVEHIHDGETIVLDSGTTALEVAKLLHDRAVTVMPLSLHIAQELADAPRIRLLMPGGEARKGELALVGPLTIASLRALRFDLAVLSPCAFSLDAGLTAFDLGDAEVKQEAIAVADPVDGACRRRQMGSRRAGLRVPGRPPRPDHHRPHCPGGPADHADPARSTASRWPLDRHRSASADRTAPSRPRSPPGPTSA